MADDSSLCSSCGRQRWSGDRFCATCGTEFADAGGAGIIDVDGLTVGGADGAAERTNWRDALKGLGALVGILALLVGGLYLASTGDDETTDEVAGEAAQEVDADEAEPTAEPTVLEEPTPEPDDEDAVEEETDPEASPTAKPTPTVMPSPLAELLSGRDVGARWVLAANGRSQIVAHDLETGTNHLAFGNAGMPGERLMMSDGVVELSFGEEDSVTSFLPWGTDLESSADDVIAFPGGFVGAFMDPDVGRVLLAFSEAAGELSALAVSTGETRRVSLHPSLVNGRYGFITFLDGGSSEAPAFVVGVQDETWTWTWADEWSSLSSRDPSFIGPNFIVARRCDGPASCRFSLVDYDGRQVVDSIPWTLAAWSSLSPDGATVASFVPEGAEGFRPDLQPDTLMLTDVASGDVLFVDATTDPIWPIFEWSPNSRYLLTSSYNEGSVIDVAEGQVLGTYGRSSSLGPFTSPVFVDDFVAPADP